MKRTGIVFHRDESEPSTAAEHVEQMDRRMDALRQVLDGMETNGYVIDVGPETGKLIVRDPETRNGVAVDYLLALGRYACDVEKHEREKGKTP